MQTQNLNKSNGIQQSQGWRVRDCCSGTELLPIVLLIVVSKPCLEIPDRQRLRKVLQIQSRAKGLAVL